MEQYKDRFIVSQIDKNDNSIEFSNGILIKVGEAYGDLSEIDIRRIQIRETISSHLEKELLLYSQGIKVLSLFFY
jgi:type III restriction enzyme